MSEPATVRRASIAVLVGWALLALTADLLASPLPLVVRVHGQTFIFPSVTNPPELRLEHHATLEATAEWLVPAPIPYGPLETSAFEATGLGPPPTAPDRRHWLGTDDLGRDVLARVIHGARVSLLVALGVALLAALVGGALGAAAGWWGGLVDLLISRLIEIASTFPTVFFLIAVVAALRGPSVVVLVAVLGLTLWPEPARLMRARVQQLRRRPFVLAAQALGASNASLLVRHVVPNALSPVLVSATFSVGTALLLESALSFLGLAAAPPTPSWGELLQQAHRNLVTPGAWWLAVFPGAAVVSLVLATQSLGRALERRFDGRS